MASSVIIPIEKRGTTIANNITELIGNTPMVYLSSKTNNTKAKIALKLESENPMASVKDRLALSIIEEAEKEGKITPGKSTIVEVTSGNTGIGLAFVAAVKGYKCIIVMPEQMSLERRVLINSFGAQLVLTPAALGLMGAKKLHAKILAETPDAFDASQFETTYNAKVHYETTGPEVWNQTQGKVDIFVSGVGTGGTVVGTGRYLKEKKPSVQIYGIEPSESAVINGEKPGPHKIQGMGAGFVTQVLARDREVLDGVWKVNSDAALQTAAALPKNEGIFAGISAGAAVRAALEIGAKEENAGKLIVAIIPSFGERYLSTLLFNEIKEKAAAWPVTPASEIQDLPVPASTQGNAAPEFKKE